MKQLVRLWERPTYDGSSFRFYLLYTDENGKRKQKSLGHCDRRKAERKRIQLERQLRAGAVEPASMSLNMFSKDCLNRTGKQIRESTRREYKAAMNDFIKVVGNMDYQKVSLQHGEFYRQACLDNGMSEYDVMKLAGHSSFSTTHQFYLAVADDLVDRARRATAQSLSQKLLQGCFGKVDR